MIKEYVKSLGLNVGDRFIFTSGIFAGDKAVLINPIGFRFINENGLFIYGKKTFCQSDIGKTKVKKC